MVKRLALVLVAVFLFCGVGEAITDDDFISLFLAGQLDIEAIQSAIEAGANVNAKGRSIGPTPLSIALFRQRFDLAKILVDNGAKFTPFIISQLGKDKEVIAFILQHPEGKEYMDNSTKSVKNSYWGDYTKENDYESIGEVFDAFFSKPNWKTGDNLATVIFTGVAKLNDKNAMFKVQFRIEPDNRFTMEEFTINGNSSNWGDLLATLYLGGD